MSWDVTVRVDGREIVVLSDQDMCGKDPLSEDEWAAIRQAGEHLLAFVGRDDVSHGLEFPTCDKCFAIVRTLHPDSQDGLCPACFGNLQR